MTYSAEERKIRTMCKEAVSLLGQDDREGTTKAPEYLQNFDFETLMEMSCYIKEHYDEEVFWRFCGDLPARIRGTSSMTDFAESAL